MFTKCVVSSIGSFKHDILHQIKAQHFYAGLCLHQQCKYNVSIISVKSYRNYNVVKFDDFSRPKGEFPVLFKVLLNFKDF